MSSDLYSQLEVGQVVWLVQWCSAAAYNEDGSLDLDGCELHQRVALDLKSAQDLAVQVLPNNVFDCVRIVDAVAVDDFEWGFVSSLLIGDHEYLVEKLNK